MGGRFIESDRDQMYLMPPSLREWLPEDDLAWFMLDAVEQMDLSAFYEGMSEDGAGRPGYEPRLMVTLLLYSYCLGERSSRRIERLCRRDVGYRVIAANLAAAGEERLMEKAAADAGYFSAKNLSDDPPEGPELFIATTKDWKRRKAMRDAPPPRGRIPRRLSLRERMERELLTLRGRAIYRKRSRTVEPVFGQIKDARRADRFLLRRIAGASLEWKLLCLTHNLLKLFGSGKARWSAPAAQAA